MQILIVALLVTASGVYALWTLMPATLRRAVAGFLSTCPLPAVLRDKAAAAAAAGSGCGCDGCDHAPKQQGEKMRATSRAGGVRSTPGADVRAPARPQPIVFHPRPKR